MTHTICFIDEEVESFTRNKDKFDRIGVNLCLNEYRTVETCHFKDLFSKWIKDNIPDIWIKEYKNFDTNTEIKFPVFAKNIEGRVSIGCARINSTNDYKSFLSNTNNGEEYILQEFVTGDIVGVDIIRNRKYNQLFLVQKKELMRNSNGCSTVVEIIDDKKLSKICRTISDKLDINGVVNAEFFMSKDGPKIIEINPRLPAGTSYSCSAGGNTVLVCTQT